MYQKTILIGRVTKVETGLTKANQKPKTQFGIVTESSRFDTVQEKWVKDEQFHQLVSYNQVAEHFGSKIVPGDLLEVEGEIRYYNTTDEQGNKSYHTIIVVSQFPTKLPKFWKKESAHADESSSSSSQPQGIEDLNSFMDDVPLQAC